MAKIYKAENVTLTQFRNWSYRVKKLKSEKCWTRFEFMAFRTYLYHHIRIGSAALENVVYDVARVLDLDPMLLRVLWEIHDDVELYSHLGDIPGNQKLYGDAKQMTIYSEAESNALPRLLKEYPRNIEGFSVQELLESHQEKRNPENQFICYLDKIIVRRFEAMHEMFSGNVAFFEPVFDYSFGRFGSAQFTKNPFQEKYNKILSLWNDPVLREHPFFDVISAKNGGIKYPTASSDIQDIMFSSKKVKKHDSYHDPYYCLMRGVVLEGLGSKNGKKFLLEPREVSAPSES